MCVCVCVCDHVDALGSPLQVSLRPDANCRVMYGFGRRSLSCKAGLVLVRPNVTTSAEPSGPIYGRMGGGGVLRSDLGKH